MSARNVEAVCVEALGVPIRIEVADRVLAEALREAWTWCSFEGATTSVIISADADWDASATAVMEHLTQLVTIEAVGRRAGELLMLHACVLADPDTGDAVVLVGPSGMGKTTLAAALGTRWAYLSDETAGITESGAVVPYPKPLSIRAEGEPDKRQVSPAALGLRRGDGTATPAAVVLLDRRPGAGRPTMEMIPTVPAIALLAEHTSYLAALRRPLHRVAALVHATGGLRRVTYSEAADVEAVVAELLGAQA